MDKNIKFKSIVKFCLMLVIIFCCSLPAKTKASSISERLKGRILLQVEENGEAWYVGLDKNRYYLGSPESAFILMKEKGVGITNALLGKIPIGFLNFKSSQDSDGDGLGDSFEEAIGTNVFNKDSDGDGFDDFGEVMGGFNLKGDGLAIVDNNFSQKKQGTIFIQVEGHGEAWYVNPEDGKRYFLGRPRDAFLLMRTLGLGISNDDLRLITVDGDSYSVDRTEEIIFKLVNNERELRGLESLKWNSEIAKVAREHSQNLSDENKGFASSLGRKCDLPIIHHEGFDFGVYQCERLLNRKISGFDISSENIAITSLATYNIRYTEGDGVLEAINECIKLKDKLNENFYKKIRSNLRESEKIKVIEDDIKKRREIYQDSFYFEDLEIIWGDKNELMDITVDGWMNSEGHRENILMPEVNETGIGVAYTDGGFLIVTQVFVRMMYY